MNALNGDQNFPGINIYFLICKLLTIKKTPILFSDYQYTY